MKTFLLALTMLVVFGGAFASTASARDYCYRRSYYSYDDPYYYDGYYPRYRTYHRVYYERPYYSYHRHYYRRSYDRPRVAFFFGF